MSSFNKHKKLDSIKWVITFVLLAVLTIAVVFAFVKIDKTEKTKTIDNSIFTYSIGLIDEEGNYEQGTTSIYTKDFISADGLEVKLDDDATISYKLFFFDENKELLDTTENFDGYTMPETAEFVKVMITPTNDPEVSIFEVGTYASQLTITVNK